MIRNIVFDMGMVLMDYHPLAASRAVAPDEESAQKIYETLFRCPEWAMTDEGTLALEELAPVAAANLNDPALAALIQVFPHPASPVAKMSCLLSIAFR